MGIVNELFNVEERSVAISDVDNFLDYMLSGGTSGTGVRVTEAEAMKHAAVFSCVKVLAEDVASLPLIVYRRIDDRSKKRAPTHWLYPLLHDSPNSEMDALIYKELIMANLLLWGNHYSFKEKNQTGKITALWPMLPNKMSIYRERAGGPLIYGYGVGNDIVEYRSDEIWHIRGLGSNGIVGYSPIRQMAEAIGFGIAVQKFGSQFFRQGTVLSGALKHPGRLTKDVAKRIIKSWNRSQAGLENVHKVALLEEGMDWVKLGVEPETAQFLASRKFSRSEIAGFFRMKPHKIADLEKATFSNIDEENIDYVVGSLRTWLVRIEMSAKMSLLGPKERFNFFAEFLIDALLRGNIKTRYEAYATGKQWGWLSSNMILAKENENPMGPEGDIMWMPMNMIPANSAIIQEEPSEEEPEEPQEGGDVIQFREAWRKIIQKRSVSNRKRLRKNYIKLFKASAKRVVGKEVIAVKKAIEKFIAKRNMEDFNKWLDEFYGKLPNDIEESMLPVLLSYGEAVQEAAAQEVGAEVGMTEETEKFIKGYLEVYQKRHIGSSTGQIQKIIEDTADEEVGEALLQRMDEWRERRPDKIARNEVVEAGGAVARFVYAGAGVTTLVWVAGANACPYCQELNGKTIGIEENFVDDHTDFKVEGEPTMVIRRPTSHAPLHDGCECDIVAG